jgi:hypothetical protein
MAAAAWTLALARVSYRSIAKELQCSRILVSTLIKEEQERIFSERRADMDGERATAIGTYEAVIRQCWDALANPKLGLHANNRVGYLNRIIDAQREIDHITGIKHVEVDDTTKAIDAFRQGAEMYREMAQERKKKKAAAVAHEDDAAVIRPEPTRI